ncbi:Ger(x)C family spore germination protein [Bacillus horti]|uniref:Ger(X)C family germination protein n=1 Tax=Caldalkalibacillus horti TaxID=77523 RepID=A0ABT9VUB9_9BACI|nr:Ger(x)C family spore germination protein [Bacillus horti]MDQ0164587.1 Ger(x)C family germination protein [Bacillus horti]
MKKINFQDHQKTFLLLSICIICLHLTTGCWDRRELEERVSVLGVGIDVIEGSEEGEELYKITLQIPIPIMIAGSAEGGGGGGIGAVRVISSTGTTVLDAMNNIQQRLNQEVFLGHARIIAISEAVARKGVEDILDGFRREPSIRRLLWFIVVEGEASNLMYVDPKLEQIPIVYTMTMIRNGVDTERIPDFNLGRYYIAESDSSKQPALNYIQVGEEDVSWKGIALFKKDMMVGDLDSKQSWLLMQMREEDLGGDFLVYPRENNRRSHILIRPKQINTKVKTKIENGQVQAHYEVYMQADILEEIHEGDISYAYRIDELSLATKKDFEEAAAEVIRLMQEEFQTDGLQLGSKIKARHYKEWKNMDWKHNFTTAKIDVSYKVELRRIGMKIK